MPEIRLIDVSFTYPGNHLAVEGLNLNIKQGENVAIIGQNGAGKTTTVKMMNNLERPTVGDVYIGDMNTKDYTTAQISRIIGYVFQNPDDQIFHSTVEEEVRFGPVSLKLSKERENELTEYALRITGMDKFRSYNPLDLPLSTRKFVTIAAVIAMDTEVLIFDEPTAGQDREGNRILAAVLQEMHDRGKTVITISHDMEFVAANFERVIVMAQKHLIREGTPQEIFWDFETLDKAMLKQPYVSRICRSLNVEGRIIDIDEAVQAIIRQ